MATIEEIYQWYEIEPTKCPKVPRGLTPIQEMEWEEQNLNSIKEFKNNYLCKSFEGELLEEAPAIIESISKSNIIASVRYYAKEKMRYLTSSPLTEPTYRIKYEILYDDLLYEKVRLIHNDSMVYLDGEIIKVKSINGYERVPGFNSSCPSSGCQIQLKLSKIEVINKHFLCDTLLSYVKKNEDDKNRESSIIFGILICIIGLLVGRILGGIISSIISIFVNQTGSVITYMVMIIGGSFGYYIGYTLKRT